MHISNLKFRGRGRQEDLQVLLASQYCQPVNYELIERPYLKGVRWRVIVEDSSINCWPQHALAHP